MKKKNKELTVTGLHIYDHEGNLMGEAAIPDMSKHWRISKNGAINIQAIPIKIINSGVFDKIAIRLDDRVVGPKRALNMGLSPRFFTKGQITIIHPQGIKFNSKEVFE